MTHMPPIHKIHQSCSNISTNNLKRFPRLIAVLDDLCIKKNQTCFEIKIFVAMDSRKRGKESVGNGGLRA
ncbi:hypothetical protein BpHYR1_014566 [Brachionus plicatilis]|uniref:Uncharacterized protein n=1 Tax=Brachionus plicatilis TaxID=10195 RepID=A0A3M7PTA5_BRAPC|nr:hypothetical protein BpHYR1_014566 [Brachionus plicatilis]